MAKGEGELKGETTAAKLANQIACIKYTLFCFNIVAWVSNYFIYFLIPYHKE